MGSTVMLLERRHVLNSAIDHPNWCEWVGLVPGMILPLTGGLVFRCPGCWGQPADRAVVAE